MEFIQGSVDMEYLVEKDRFKPLFRGEPTRAVYVASGKVGKTLFSFKENMHKIEFLNDSRCIATVPGDKVLIFPSNDLEVNREI